MDVYAETGLVRFEYHHFPGIGEESVRTAIASECANEQDMFWPYHDTIFLNWVGENTGTYSGKNLTSMAVGLGMDESAFSECMDNNSYREEIAFEQSLAAELGVRSTPTIIINGQLLIGLRTLEEYQPIIDNILASFSP